MKSTRRTFFAAIGAAVLGKYAVKFWPELAPPANRQAVVDYVTACHEQAALTFAAYIDEMMSIKSSWPRQNALIENINTPYYQINGNVGNYLGIRKLRTNLDPARLPA